MKIWKDIRLNPFDWFERWEKLSPETKQLFLKEIGSNLKVDPQLFSEAARRELLQAGFMLPDKTRLAEPVRPFRNLVRSMGRHRHFEQAETDLSVDYVSDHLTTYECSDLPALAGSRHFGRDAGIAAKEVVESSWLKAFINCKSAKEWEYPGSIHSQCYFGDDSFKLLQRWVERLIKSENPLPLSALLKEAGGDAGLAAGALRGGIRYLILFPSLFGAELRPVVGVWPAIHDRMNRPAAVEPRAGALPEGFHVYNVRCCCTT
jgi:hypothetical protein